MKVTLSYSGGTARGLQLAREFDKRGYLREFYIPSYSRKVDFCPRIMAPWLGPQALDIRKVRTNVRVQLLRTALRRTASLRGAKPTERYRVNEMIDHWVARNLRRGTDVLIVEAQIALHTLRRGQELGMIAILDRTNSHVVYQSQVMDEENARYGVRWKASSERETQKALQEYDQADYIFVLSKFAERTFLERNVPRHKVVRVPSGIDLKPFRQVEKEDDVFRVIYCGAVHNKKGTQYLLQAFAELNLHNAELMLIGTVFDDMVPILKQHAGRYKHLGYVPNAELYKHYSQGSVFVLPSLEEGLAKVIIESMSCGLPVVATTNTGAEDVVREGVDGFIVPIRDVGALKEKIAYLYDNPALCREMGQNARERVHAEFTLDAYANRMIQALTMVLGNRGNPPMRQEGYQ